MNRRLLLKFSLFTLISLAGLSFGSQSNASALICKVLSPAIESSPPSNKDCLTNGQSQSDDLSFSAGSTNDSDALKRQFISQMTKFESGQNLQKVGASYIEARIEGDSGMFWKDRLNLSDVTLSIDKEYTYKSNSGYNPYPNNGMGRVEVLDTSQGTAPALVFKVDGVLGFAIKLHCGNPLDDMTLPGPPKIRGYKIDDIGNPIGPYSNAVIRATNAVPSSDINQPFKFRIQANSTVVTAPKVNGYTVIGSSLTNSCKEYNCPIVPTYNPVLGPTVGAYNTNPGATGPNFVSGESRTFSTLRAGHKYDMRWVYKKDAPTAPPVTFTGFKKDTSGNTVGPFSTDTIRASYQSNPNQIVASNSGQPYTLSVAAGDITVSPADAVGSGWSAILKSVNKTQKGGDIVNLDWVYSKVVDPPMCPASNLPNPPNVNVSLPDLTPVVGAPSAAAFTPNNWYYQNTSQNKTKVLSIQDISSGGNRLLSMLNLKSESYQQAVVDYMPFVLGYPYDNNQASVTYSYSYTVTPWLSASTPSYYDYSYWCSYIAGSNLVSGPDGNNNCTYSKPDVMTTYPARYNTIDAQRSSTTTYTAAQRNSTTSYTYATPTYNTSYIRAGSVTYPNTCYKIGVRGKIVPYSCPTTYYYCSYPYSGPVGNQCSITTITYSCPSGVSPVGDQCPTTTITYSCLSGYTPATRSSVCTPTTPTCNGSDQLIGTTCYPTQTYTQSTIKANRIDTPRYSYTPQASYTQIASNTANGLAMTCFPRGFSVTDVSAASANVSLNDNENPTSVSAGGYSASVRFFYTNRNPTQGLRQPMTAKLSYGYKLSPITCTQSNIPFTVTGGYGPSGPSSYAIPNAGAGCPVSVPPLDIGDTVCVTYSISPTGSWSNVDGSVVKTDGGTLTSGERCSGPVVNKPYFKVFGSDISVGGGFYATVNGNKTCTSTISSIFGWNSGTNSVYTNRYSGAGAQFLLSSTGSLKGAASNQNNPNASPWPAFTNGSPKSDPIGFSFANIGTNSAANNYGTSLGAANCIPDYYSSLPTSPTPSSLGNNSSLSGNSSIYTMPGGSTIKSSNIGPRDRVTVYVNGDLYIDGDINFVGSYSTINDIPSLIVIVKDGNIYIKKTVANLSGIFIAQSTISNKGYIYDCALDFLPIANNQLFDSCVTQLTVNGSFIANKVVLNRTGNANKDMISSSLRRASSTETNTSSNATEIFNYGPAFWINTALPITSSAGTNSAGYDSIINLPPVL